jgi:hypothetical protein
MDDFSHSGSVSGDLQMMVPQRVRVFGHYAVDKVPGQLPLGSENSPRTENTKDAAGRLHVGRAEVGELVEERVIDTNRKAQVIVEPAFSSIVRAEFSFKDGL